MTTPVSYLPTCHICKKPVTLELAKTDEQGRSVHEDAICSRSIQNQRFRSKPKRWLL